MAKKELQGEDPVAVEGSWLSLCNTCSLDQEHGKINNLVSKQNIEGKSSELDFLVMLHVKIMLR